MILILYYRDYQNFVSEGILVNSIGVFLVIFGALAVYLVSQGQYKRQPRPEDNVLLTNRD